MGWKKGLALCLAVVMLFSLVACQKKPVRDTSPELNFETDHQYWLADGPFTFVAESETGFYYMEERSYPILYYADKETMEAIPLCNKPNCVAHNNPMMASQEELDDCNAYFEAENSKFMYYEGYLYAVIDDVVVEGNTVTHGFTLTRISLDGTERKAIWKIDPGVSVGFASIWDFLIHRGVFYVTVDNVLFGYDMESKKVEMLREFETLPSLFAMGDYLFVRSEGNGIDEGRFRYTISTGEWEKCPEGYIKEFPHRDGIYYYYYEDTPTERLWGVETDLLGENERVIEYEKNLTVRALNQKYLLAQDTGWYRSKETGERMTTEEYIALAEKYEDNWLEIENRTEWVEDSTYEVYDRETMEALGQLPLITKVYRYWFSEDRIYCFAVAEQQEQNNYAPMSIFYADLSDLGSEDFGWKQVVVAD